MKSLSSGEPDASIILAINNIVQICERVELDTTLGKRPMSRSIAARFAEMQSNRNGLSGEHPEATKFRTATNAGIALDAIPASRREELIEDFRLASQSSTVGAIVSAIQTWLVIGEQYRADPDYKPSRLGSLGKCLIWISKDFDEPLNGAWG